MKIHQIHCLAALAGLAFSTSATNAAIVNFNMVGSDTALTTTTNPGYGLWDQGTQTWNIDDAESVTGLVDSTGDATTIGYTSSGFGSRNGGNDGWGPDQMTRQGRFTGSNDDVAISTLTITGLTEGLEYNLLFYFAGNNRSEVVTANGASPTTFTGSTTTTGGATYTEGTHFWYFESITANSSDEILLNISGPNRETITGFQIEAIPEPSAALLCGLGLLALLRRRR